MDLEQIRSLATWMSGALIEATMKGGQELVRLLLWFQLAII